MSTYAKCPYCENDEAGETIWSCGECGCVHCKKCDDENGSCPECGSDKMNSVGVIDPESANNEDSGEENIYTECPRCGKNDDGDTIWQCRDCKCVHCNDCDPDGGNCPSCNGNRIKNIGYIRNE